MFLFHIFKFLFHCLLFRLLNLLLKVKSIFFFHLLPNVRNKLFISCIPLIVVQRFIMCLQGLMLCICFCLLLIFRGWINFYINLGYQRVLLIHWIVLKFFSSTFIFAKCSVCNILYYWSLNFEAFQRRFKLFLSYLLSLRSVH